MSWTSSGRSGGGSSGIGDTGTQPGVDAAVRMGPDADRPCGTGSAAGLAGCGGCYTITDGTLVIGGRGVPASWPDMVSLGLPMTVRAPVWDGWGSTVSLTGDTENAIIAVLVGLFIDAVGAFGGLALVVMTRHLAEAPAPACPGRRRPADRRALTAARRRVAQGGGGIRQTPGRTMTP